MITIVVDPKHANVLVCPRRVQDKSSRQLRRVREKEKERGRARARASLNAKGPQTHEKKRTRSRTTRGNSVRFCHFSRVERFHRCRRSVTDRFGEGTTTSSRLCSAFWTRRVHVVVRLLVSRKVDSPPSRSRVSLLSSEAEPTRTDGRDRRGRRKTVQQQRQKTRAASSESVSNGTHSSIESNVRAFVFFVSYF